MMVDMEVDIVAGMLGQMEVDIADEMVACMLVGIEADGGWHGCLYGVTLTIAYHENEIDLNESLKKNDFQPKNIFDLVNGDFGQSGP